MTSTTPLAEFSPLHNLIFSVSLDDASAMSQDELLNYIKQVQELSATTYDRMESLSKEFDDLRNKNLELEDTIKLLHENLDKQRESMLEADYETYRQCCEAEYSDFWDKLDFNSKEFFITARYIYDRSKSRNADFSPVIIEFCRIFENELLEKIFRNFIQNQSTLSRLLSYQNRVFSKVEKAVNDQTNDGSFFLSSMDMLKLLGHMGRTFRNPGYELELQNFIRRQGFDTTQISDRTGFVDPAKDYVDQYRNGAAHPNFFHENVAEDCQEKTVEYVGKFLAAKS